MIDFIQTNINLVLTTFTLISNIVFVVIFVFVVINVSFRNWIYDFVNKYVLSLLFATSLSAVVGSLLYSNIVGFSPCELCWIQRIFMYPQPLLLILAMKRKDKNIVDYLLPLSILGGIVALYHSMTHLGLGDGLVGCTSALGDCGKLYVFEYGYITIPFMAFTCFAYLIGISVLYKKSINGRI